MILIRKECQTILDANGLEQYHVQASESRWAHDTSYLEIVTECGQKLVQVKGILTKKSKYSVAERKYTVELFSEFITKYLADIQEYLQCKKILKLKETRVERLKKKGYRGDLPVVYVKGKIKREILGISYDEGPFYVTVFKGVVNPRVVMHMVVPTCKSLTDLSKQNAATHADIRSFKLDPKRITVARAHVIEFGREIEEQDNAEARIKELTEGFESCTI